MAHKTLINGTVYISTHAPLAGRDKLPCNHSFIF